MIDIEDSELSTVPDLVFGIDLGTTNSLIARFDGSDVVFFPDDLGRVKMPSIVAVCGEKLKVGYEAIGLECSVRSVKRLMGKCGDLSDLVDVFDFSNEDLRHVSVPKLNLGPGCIMNPQEISAAILSKLVSRVKSVVGGGPVDAVITVPAYFDDTARQATKLAAEMANIKVLRLLNEPTSALLSFDIDREANDGDVYVVYDFGGGTFDVSVLKYHYGLFRVLAVGGDTALGGDDIDSTLLSHVVQAFSLHNGGDISLSYADRLVLLDEIRLVKEQLTVDTEVCADFTVAGKKFSMNISSQLFESLIKDIVIRTVDIVRSTLDSAYIESDCVRSVLLVGGSSNVPLVRKLLSAIFDDSVMRLDNEPDLAVAKGAAVQAYNLSSSSISRTNKAGVLVDVLPLSLGIETVGGITSKIIYRNTPIPTSETQSFTTSVNGQTDLLIHVLQGESDLVRMNKSIASFTINGLTPDFAGKVKVDVEFKVDVDGILTVTATECATGLRKSIEVNHTYGLTSEFVNEVVEDALHRFDLDSEARKLAEAKLQACTLIQEVEGITGNSDFAFSSEDVIQINSNLAALKTVVDSEDLHSISKAVAELERETIAFLQMKSDKVFRSVGS